MKNLAVYDGESGVFNFDLERLTKAGIELNALNCKEPINPASEVALDLLIFKALQEYLSKEKIISFDAMDCYRRVLKKSSELVRKIKDNHYFLPQPINPNSFNQDEILQFYQGEKFNSLLGMLNFLEKKYVKEFEK